MLALLAQQMAPAHRRTLNLSSRDDSSGCVAWLLLMLCRRCRQAVPGRTTGSRRLRPRRDIASRSGVNGTRRRRRQLTSTLAGNGPTIRKGAQDGLLQACIDLMMLNVGDL